MKKKLRLLLSVSLSILLVISLIGCSAGDNNKPLVDKDPKAGEQVPANIIKSDYPAEIEKYLDENSQNETQQAFNIDNRTYIVLPEPAEDE